MFIEDSIAYDLAIGKKSGEINNIVITLLQYESKTSRVLTS